jgi:gluconolactonase
MMDQYEVLDPRFLKYVLPNAPLLKLGEGFAWLEGPVWFGDQDCLLVSDLPNDRIMRWTVDGGLSVFRTPSGFANGNTRDREGRLLSCSHKQRCIVRTELDGNLTILVDNYLGKRLNSPNDVICRSDGTIWFTDPLYGISTDYEGGKQTSELPPSVYRFDPRDLSLRVMIDNFEGPNGIAFSPDERLLYVSESGEQFSQNPVQCIHVFDVGDQGSRLSGNRVFHKITAGYSDGFRLDQDGNLWSSAADGVHCVAPDGTLLGLIRVPFVVSNLAFGGRNRSQLFICASHTLFAIYTNQRGAQLP